LTGGSQGKRGERAVGLILFFASRKNKTRL
jgi:hypothetical protein